MGMGKYKPKNSLGGEGRGKPEADGKDVPRGLEVLVLALLFEPVHG